MTLDELIEQAQALRADGAPGAAPVLLMTAAGIVPVAALGDSLGFADRDGGGPATVILVLPNLTADRELRQKVLRHRADKSEAVEVDIDKL